MPVEALKERIAEFGDSAFLITANAEGRVHVVSAAPRFAGDELVIAAGRTTRANVAANPLVTLLWPRSPDGAHSLIVDGLATADSNDDAEMTVAPSRAVLHHTMTPSAMAQVRAGRRSPRASRSETAARRRTASARRYAAQTCDWRDRCLEKRHQRTPTQHRHADGNHRGALRDALHTHRCQARRILSSQPGSAARAR